MLNNTVSALETRLPSILAKELTESNATYYPRASVTDAGTDFDGKKYTQVRPATVKAGRAVRDMNRSGSRFYVVRLDMVNRTYNVRAFAGSRSYAVPVTPAYKPEPDANAYLDRLDDVRLSRVAFAYQNFLNAHGFTLRVSGNSAGTSFHVTACAMFASEADALRFATDNRIGYVYRPDGSTLGTGCTEDDATE